LTKLTAHRAAVAAAILAGAAAVVFLRVPLCPMALLLHVPCPGCGLTRAAFLLAHGELRAATQVHPLSMVLVPVLALFALRAAYGYVASGAVRIPDDVVGRPAKIGSAVLLAVVIGVWVARFCGMFGGPVAV
jgi:hypothetical protein